MGITCVTPNIAKVGKSYKVTAKVIINFSDVYKGEKDHSIIHELNHLYELALKEVSDSTYKTISGWDIVEEKIDSQEITDEEDKRKYELLNEIINEKIAKEISKMMADKNIKIFDERVNADYQNKTGYDQTNYIVDEFFETFKREIKVIDNAIEKEIKGLNPNAFIILQSIDGIGPVFAGGIIAEIGDITAFHSSDALAKYAGLTWKSNQSGDFDGEDTPMIKAGNRYLRYYLGEAANSMRKHNVEYGTYYRKKYNEVPKHQHKRALALTSRKFVRLVYGLLARNQLYSGVSLDTSIKDSN